MINLYNVMTKNNKGKLVNFRVSEELKTDFETAAKLRGGGLSNLIHLYLVEIVRVEKERNLKGFEEMRQKLLQQQIEKKAIKNLKPQARKVSGEKVKTIKPQVSNGKEKAA
ncbi:MAG: hypothetical protein M3367_03330 [Acidobacteriota bacterium]|nr:hypothetical protein [Acidobacteriota bacterium]